MTPGTFRRALMAVGLKAKLEIDHGSSRDRALEAANLSVFGHDRIARDMVLALFPSFGLAWAESAFSQFEIGTKLAASMMATSISREVADALEPPWRCFGVNVAAGLLSDTSGFALVLFCRDGHVRYLAMVDDLGIQFGDEPSVGGYAKIEMKEVPNGSFLGVSFDDAKARALPLATVKRIELLGKLMVGCCLELGGKTSIETTTSGRDSIRTKRGLPEPWTYVLGRKVSVDARPAIAAYIRGNGISPTVQCLVRGHWKNQPCGPEAKERKFIHVEPYWRGPEDAPIAVRPHVLGGSDNA